MSEGVCPCCGEPVPVEVAFQIVAAAVLARPLSERSAARRADLWADVAAYLARNPDASANAVAASVTGRRLDVLHAVRELRRRAEVVPDARNQSHDEAAA